jgi:hypothetical protein
MNELVKYNEILNKYDVDIVKEFFYILLSCIDSSIDRYEKVIEIFRNEENYEKLKNEYKEFYDYVLNYLHSISISKEMFLHTQTIDLVDTLLELDEKYIKNSINIIISNVIDVVFFKYNLNISNFETNEDIKNYLIQNIEDETIVNSLIMLLLSSTSLDMEYVKEVPEEDIEHVLREIILISLYICKKDRNERNSKTDS